MNILGTSGIARGLIGAIAVAANAGAAYAEIPSPSVLEDTTVRVEASLRATVIKESSPYNDDDFTSFFDQYRYVATENDSLPWHLDFRRLGIAFEKPDGRRPLLLERESRGWANEDGRIAFRLPSWRGELGYSRFRTAERRLFPVGTGAALPVFGTVYNSELSALNPLGAGDRLAVRRNWVGGELGYRNHDSSSDDIVVTEGRVFGSYETRSGRRQDRFLVESNGAITETERFRGRQRNLNQESVTAGISATLATLNRFTTKGEIRFEGFRERSSAYLFSDLVAADAGVQSFEDPRVDGRSFGYVPDTNRIIASLSTSGRVGKGHVRVVGHFAHLRQSGAGSPVQRLAGLEENVVNEGSIRSAFRIPLHRKVALRGHVRAQWRHNRVGRSSISRSTLFFYPVQTNAYIRRRREVEASSELTYRPRSGSVLLAGFDLKDIYRDRAFGTGPTSIPDAYNLIEGTTRTFRVYAEGRQRVGRAGRLFLETGYAWSPQVALARDAEESVYAKARYTASISLPMPASLTLHGAYRRRENHDQRLTSTTVGASRKKAFDQEEWSYGATATLLAPLESRLVATFLHARDAQQFDHVRSNIPRNSGDPGLLFFTDSRPDYRSDIKSLYVGASVPLVEAITARVGVGVNWIDVGYHGGSATSQSLDAVNRLQDRITSAEVGLEWASGSWAAEMAYRYDDYNDRADRDPLEADVSAQSGWIQITYRR